MGAGIIISAIQSFVSRINRICDFVDHMPENNYRNSYIDDGDDEIETLSRKIDKIRNIINKNEANREMMLQNISHDLKTPIAVIKSYAEAIGDGIEDVSQTQIIIEQSAKLEKKVRNLIEFNKLEYLYTDQFENVNMKEIVEKIVNNCKHISSIEFELDLDDSCFLGRAENLFTVVENIVDNGMRYAKEKITITLHNRVLSIHNDGEAISQDFIQNGFRPYSKGHEGKFGLGMSIVVKTLERFDLKLMVANENGGVTFKILEKNNEEGE